MGTEVNNSVHLNTVYEVSVLECIRKTYIYLSIATMVTVLIQIRICLA